MTEVPILLALRGLPASGKSTYARLWAGEDPQRRFRINRDGLRAMAHNSQYVEALPGMRDSTGTERLIVQARDAILVGLLRAGVSVVVDDTNLTDGHIRELAGFARAAGARFEMRAFTPPFEVCWERNAARTGPDRVPDDKMRLMRDLVGNRDLSVMPDLSDLAV